MFLPTCVFLWSDSRNVGGGPPSIFAPICKMRRKGGENTVATSALVQNRIYRLKQCRIKSQHLHPSILCLSNCATEHGDLALCTFFPFIELSTGSFLLRIMENTHLCNLARTSGPLGPRVQQPETDAHAPQINAPSIHALKRSLKYQVPRHLHSEVG